MVDVSLGRTPDGRRIETVGTDRSRIVLELPLWAPWYVPLCYRALSNLARLADEHDSTEQLCATVPVRAWPPGTEPARHRVAGTS